MLYEIKPLTSETPGFGFGAGDVGNGGNRSTERLREPGAGSTASSPRAFLLVVSGAGGSKGVDVLESELGGAVPSGFTDGVKSFTVSSGTGVIYAKLTISGTTGNVTARAVEKGSALPANTETTFHALIGRYTVTGSGSSKSVTVFNYRYGPIPATICRNWFAAEAPFHTVILL